MRVRNKPPNAKATVGSCPPCLMFYFLHDLLLSALASAWAFRPGQQWDKIRLTTILFKNHYTGNYSSFQCSFPTRSSTKTQPHMVMNKTYFIDSCFTVTIAYNIQWILELYFKVKNPKHHLLMSTLSFSHWLLETNVSFKKSVVQRLLILP